MKYKSINLYFDQESFKWFVVFIYGHSYFMSTDQCKTPVLQVALIWFIFSLSNWKSSLYNHSLSEPKVKVPNSNSEWILRILVGVACWYPQ